MSGRDHYINEEEDMSKREKRIRIACAIFAVVLGLLFIAAIIVLLVVFIPRNPQVGILSFTADGFNMNYCPSNVESSCCTNSTSCGFTYSALTFNQTATVQIQNFNHVVMSYDSITATTSYGNLILGTAKIGKGYIPADQTVNVPVAYAWNATGITNANMALLMCAISDAPSRQLTVTVSMNIQNLVYIATNYGSPTMNANKDLDMTGFCDARADKCKISTTYHNKVCFQT